MVLVGLSKDRRGQYLGGLSIAYAFVMLGLAIFIIGFVLILVSEDFLALYIHSYGVDAGVDSSILSYFETMRAFLPLACLIGLGVSMVVGAYVYRG